MSCAEHCTLHSIGAMSRDGGARCNTRHTAHKRMEFNRSRVTFFFWCRASLRRKVAGNLILSTFPSDFPKMSALIISKGGKGRDEMSWRREPGREVEEVKRRGLTRRKRLKEEDMGERGGWDVERQRQEILSSRATSLHPCPAPAPAPALPPSLGTTFPRIFTSAAPSLSTLSTYLPSLVCLFGAYLFTFLILSQPLTPLSTLHPLVSVSPPGGMCPTSSPSKLS